MDDIVMAETHTDEEIAREMKRKDRKEAEELEEDDKKEEEEKVELSIPTFRSSRSH
jgi:hypothetical protein